MLRDTRIAAFLAAGLVATAVTSCTGVIQGDQAVSPGTQPPGQSPQAPVGPGSKPMSPPTSPPSMAGAPPSMTGVPLSCAAGRPGLRRLSHREYDNTVRDLLGTSLRPGRGFPTDAESLGFDNVTALLTVSPPHADAYADAAALLAAEASRDLGKLLPCDPGTAGEEACARVFVETWVHRAYRRPATADDLEGLLAVYRVGRRVDFINGIRLVIEASLSAPSFLYREERGDASVAGPHPRPLTPHELANRLSYFLWGSPPDPELAAAADRGTLGGPELLAQARRLLASPRAADTIDDFSAQWLGTRGLGHVEKDGKVYPDFPSLRELMREESSVFVRKIVLEGDGRLETLLTAPYTFGEKNLARHYGVNAPTGAGWSRLDLDAEKRAGILTQAGLLAVYASPDGSDPVLRGKLVREKLLCQTLPDPPPDVPLLSAPAPTVTTRERFAEHSKDPACAVCHGFLDPIGFGLEHYDGIGRWRDQDGGKDVDASGHLTNTDVDGPFTGAVQLAAKLAGSKDVRSCMVRQWFRYAHGRADETTDACDLRAIGDAFAASSHDVRALLLALVQTDGFRFVEEAP